MAAERLGQLSVSSNPPSPAAWFRRSPAFFWGPRKLKAQNGKKLGMKDASGIARQPTRYEAISARKATVIMRDYGFSV